MATVESNGHNPSPSFEDLFFDDKEPKVESMADRVPDLWPEIEVGNQEDSNSMRKQPTQWNIQTEGEQYIKSLEKRLKTAKAAVPVSHGRNNCTSSDGPVLHLSSSLHDDSGSENGYGQSSLQDEEAAVVANETTCLLYDARQQQKEHERMLREARHSEDTTSEQCHAAHSRDRSSSLQSSLRPDSRRSSIDSDSPKQTGQPIPEQPTPQQTVFSRIHFSDSVRISGGIKSKSKRDKRRISASSVFAPPNAYGTFDTGEDVIASTSNLEQSGTPPALLGNIRTPRGSFSRSSVSGRISRAASFLSEDGTATGRSRASTPASIYAPLLLPSKTAPSPSRHFYLTFKRDNGQATYRELVRRQGEGKKRGRTRSRRAAAATEQDDEEDSDTDSVSYIGQGWFCGLEFWTCGLHRLVQRRRQRRKGCGRSTDIEVGPSSSPSNDDRSYSSSVASDDDGEAPSGLPENKSEMEVLFGRKPWRYIQTAYWLYRLRALRSGGDRALNEEEW